jgi:hypothetical protein
MKDESSYCAVDTGVQSARVNTTLWCRGATRVAPVFLFRHSSIFMTYH